MAMHSLLLRKQLNNMRYVNKMTGTSIETNAILSGENWEEVSVKKEVVPEEVKEEPKEKKKTTKK